MSNRLFVILLCITALMSCKNNSSSGDTEGNGIYYWRTSFSLNDKEREFLNKHDVDKLYIKFFDVEKDWKKSKGDLVIPIATIHFKDTVPSDIDVVPTIYITTQAMEAMQLKEGEYAVKILKRVNAICRRNSINYDEIQLDCDWTKSTRKYFFRLCEEIKQRLDSTKILSSTIRLHQLIQTPPPVDKGVLMVYNTGNLMDMTTDNSIFSRKDIEPYLKDDRLAKYDLPLDIAYPAYSWSLVFSRDIDNKYNFRKISRQTDLSKIQGLKKIGKNIYEATGNAMLDSLTWVYEGNRIRVERPSVHEILEIKNMIDRQLNGKAYSNILYHLDETQLSCYSDNEINKIYSCN